MLNLLNNGQLAQAENAAKNLLRSFPSFLLAHHVLGIALDGQRRHDEAIESYRKAIAIDNKVPELHLSLGAALANVGRHEEAVNSYRKTVALKPNMADAYFNLGISLQQLGRFEEAVPSYRKAIALQPGFFEAYANLGTVLQRQGKLEEALDCYKKAIAIHPDAKGHFNLATALRDQGKLDEAILSYKAALALFPQYADAHNNLGEALRDQGKMDEAIRSYQAALSISPDHPGANYNMAEFLYLAQRYDEAIPHFERSQLEDWQDRILYCLYKAEKFDAFKERLQQRVVGEKHLSPFLANLSAHYATNFGTEDPYTFCPDPMAFVYHNSIAPLAADDGQLLQDLLRDITFTEIAERKQGRLHYGIQSAGNLFKRAEPSFKALADLIKKEVMAYREKFAAQDCELMKSFPKEIEFASSWYVKMQKGGHLTSHIHEIGWLSGCVYLALPKEKSGPNDGSIEFSMDGDDYPVKGGHFPARAIAPHVGDIVLFPSSLFHRTIPFNSNEDRICVAFDIKPA